MCKLSNPDPLPVLAMCNMTIETLAGVRQIPDVQVLRLQHQPEVACREVRPEYEHQRESSHLRSSQQVSRSQQVILQPSLLTPYTLHLTLYITLMVVVRSELTQ